MHRRTMIVLGVALSATTASAQTSLLEGIVKNASDMNIYAQFIRPPGGPLVPRHNLGAGGFGFELSYDFSDTVVNGDKGALKLSLGHVPLRLEAGVGYDQSGSYKLRSGAADVRVSIRDL